MAKKYFSLHQNDGGTITCIPYVETKQFEYIPKLNYRSDEIININKMILNNQSLISLVVDKTCKKRLEIILRLLTIIYDDEEDDGSIINLTMEQINKFKDLVTSKYAEYMVAKDYQLLLKKLEILERELNLRKGILDNIDDEDTTPNVDVRNEQEEIYFEDLYEEKKGKGR